MECYTSHKATRYDIARYILEQKESGLHMGFQVVGVNSTPQNSLFPSSARQ